LNDPANTKSYFRRGQGYKKMGNLKQALKDYKTAFEMDPTNQSVQKELLFVEKIIN